MGLFLTRTVWRFREQFVWYRTMCTALASQTQCLYIRVCGMSALHPLRTLAADVMFQYAAFCTLPDDGCLVRNHSVRAYCPTPGAGRDSIRLSECRRTGLPRAGHR